MVLEDVSELIRTKKRKLRVYPVRFFSRRKPLYSVASCKDDEGSNRGNYLIAFAFHRARGEILAPPALPALAASMLLLRAGYISASVWIYITLKGSMF